MACPRGWLVLCRYSLTVTPAFEVSTSPRASPTPPSGLGRRLRRMAERAPGKRLRDYARSCFVGYLADSVDLGGAPEFVAGRDASVNKCAHACSVQLPRRSGLAQKNRLPSGSI
jgi:hypothetical protein